MTILCVIIIQGNFAIEEGIREMPNVMVIYAKWNHFFHADFKKITTQDSVQEKYLDCHQMPNSNPSCQSPGVHAETSKINILEFCTLVHDMVPSTSWCLPKSFDRWRRDSSRQVCNHVPYSWHSYCTFQVYLRSFFQPYWSLKHFPHPVFEESIQSSCVCSLRWC